MAKLVIGCGESTVDAIRTADNDPENMTLARFLFPDHARRSEHLPDRPLGLTFG